MNVSISAALKVCDCLFALKVALCHRQTEFITQTFNWRSTPIYTPRSIYLALSRTYTLIILIWASSYGCQCRQRHLLKSESLLCLLVCKCVCVCECVICVQGSELLARNICEQIVYVPPSLPPQKHACHITFVVSSCLPLPLPLSVCDCSIQILLKCRFDWL